MIAERQQWIRRFVTWCATAVLLVPAGGAWGQQAAGKQQQAQHEIAGLKGVKLTETPHYRLYYTGKSPSKFGTTIEKVWAESAKLMPRLGAIFETGDPDAEPATAPTNAVGRAGTVAGAKSSRLAKAKKEKEEAGTEAFKLTLIFVEERSDFETAARGILPANLGGEDRARADEAVKSVPTISTADGLTRVYWLEDPNMKTKGYDIFVSHCNTTDLVALHQGESKSPFWLPVGLGYATEFKFFGKSVTAYLDYEKYYRESMEKAAGGKYTAKETLAIGKPWAPILKSLMQKGKKGNLQAVLTADTATLTPETCGYMYAFAAFLQSDPKKCEMLADFLARMRANEGQDAEKHLLEAYGYENADALQNDWHAYILSGRFK